MTNEFTAVFIRDGRYLVAVCPEVPEALGQGGSLEEAREDLIEAIKLVFEVRREMADREWGAGEHREVVTVA